VVDRSNRNSKTPQTKPEIMKLQMPPLGSSVAAILIALVVTASANAQQKPATEDDFYRITTLPIPKGVVLEAGGLELLPSGQLAASSRRGDIYLIDNPFSEPAAMKFTRYAQGLHEVLGLAYRDGWLYATQRCEVTRMKDTDNDGRADLFETVNSDWGITGDYHEYAFGSKFDARGDLWVVLCLTGSFTSNIKYRGWCLRIKPDGTSVPTCSGLRSPGGIGMNHLGDMFYTDNQGPWNGTSKLQHLQPGKFVGHPGGNRWYDITNALGKRPADPKSGSRMMVEAKRIPELLPPAIYFPYKKMGQSASGIACDTTNGKFGVFKDQLFVGDQTHSTVMRVDLEKVQGQYQGACFPFRGGFGSGSLGLLISKTGSMFVSGTNRGWGSRGNKPFSLQRLDWTGKRPFEVLTMRLRPDGFRLQFTEPIDPATAARIDSYQLQTYTYIYQASYGSPEVDHTKPTIKEARVAADRRHVDLVIDQLAVGHIHELHLPGIRSADNKPLLHQQAYYTLNYLAK
jgi:glucose/arabinose dehydrogenase